MIEIHPFMIVAILVVLYSLFVMWFHAVFPKSAALAKRPQPRVLETVTYGRNGVLRNDPDRYYNILWYFYQFEWTTMNRYGEKLDQTFTDLTISNIEPRYDHNYVINRTFPLRVKRATIRNFLQDIDQSIRKELVLRINNPLISCSSMDWPRTFPEARKQAGKSYGRILNECGNKCIINLKNPKVIAFFNPVWERLGIKFAKR